MYRANKDGEITIYSNLLTQDPDDINQSNQNNSTGSIYNIYVCFIKLIFLLLYIKSLTIIIYIFNYLS